MTSYQEWLTQTERSIQEHNSETPAEDGKAAHSSDNGSQDERSNKADSQPDTEK